jgi:hypothetical protein
MAKTIKKRRKTTIKRYFCEFFLVKNENKVFCLKIDDFLNVFGFFMGLCRGLIHNKYYLSLLVETRI